MGSELPPEEVDPIARKLTEAAAHKQEAADAASGEHLPEADFKEFAGENGPAEFKTIEQLAMSRAAASSAQGADQVVTTTVQQIQCRLTMQPPRTLSAPLPPNSRCPENEVKSIEPRNEAPPI